MTGSLRLSGAIWATLSHFRRMVIALGNGRRADGCGEAQLTGARRQCFWDRRSPMLRHVSDVTAILSTIGGVGSIHYASLDCDPWLNGTRGALLLVAGAVLWMRALRLG